MANLLDSNLTDYLSIHPCVQCFHGKELDALIVTLLAEYNGNSMPESVGQLVDTTACLKCLTDTQLKQSFASYLWQITGASATSDELMEKMKCLLCADEKTIKVLISYLLTLSILAPPT